MKIQSVLVFSLMMFSPFIFASEESHQKAAKELIEILNMDEMMDAMYENMNTNIAQSLVKQDPCLEPVKKPLANLFTKYNQKVISKENFKKKMQEIYAEEFTESEILEITAFYKRPVGQKTLKKMPLLMTKSAEFAQRALASSDSSEARTKLRNDIKQLIKNIDPKQLSPECKKHFEKEMQQ